MKTKNNVQKAVLKTTAVIVSLVLLSFSVGAQGSWKKLLADNSFGDIARILVENNSDTETPITMNTIYFDYEIEESDLEIETWMTSNSNFSSFLSEFYEISDESLTLEDWMLEESSFYSNNSEEDALQIESWMTEGNFWNK